MARPSARAQRAAQPQLTFPDRTAAQGANALAKLGSWIRSGTPHLVFLTSVTAVLIVLGFALSGPDVTASSAGLLSAGDWTQPATWGALLYRTGMMALTYVVPTAVSGYVAYGLAGGPALLPGIVGGLTAMGIGTGPLGGLLAGLTAAAAAGALTRLTVPKALRGLTSAVLVPVLATAATAFLTIAVLGQALNAFTNWLHGQLVDLEFLSLPLLGLVAGALVCSDLGGLVTRSVIAFGSMEVIGADPSKLSPINMTIMAAIVAAGMVPPLAMTLATVVRGKSFTEAERKYGKAAWLFGLVSVPEGVTPLVLGDPLRVIPACMAGGAVTGSLIANFGATVSRADGGLFGVADFGKPLLFLAAVAAGVLTTAAVTIGLKALRRPAVAQAPKHVARNRKVAPVAG
ncbi:fructose-specific PTS transporter subunit EIIC [Lentzea sp. NPDC004789]